MQRLGNEKQTFPRKSRKKMQRNWGITKNLLRRNRCRHHTCLQARMQTFYSCKHDIWCFTDVWLKIVSVARFTKECLLAIMSLFGVLVCHFPMILASLTCSLSRPSASSAPLPETRSSPCVSARWSGMSGCIANPTPDTGYEPKFRVDANDEQTPINDPDSNRGFPTLLQRHHGRPSEELDVPHTQKRPTAARIQSERAEYPPCQDHSVSASWTSSRITSRLTSRNSIRKTVVDLDRENVVCTLFLVWMEREETDPNAVQSIRVTENLHKILEEKAAIPVRGERMAQQTLFDAEAEVEARYWEKRNSYIALHEINQELESQRFQLHQASRWADQAQRDKISLYGKLELKNRHFQEKSFKRSPKRLKNWEEWICCEETYRARQASIDEWSAHQEKNPTTVGRLLTHIHELQNKENSLSDTRELLRSSRNTSGATRVPSQLSTILSPRTTLRCGSGLPNDTRNIMGTSGNVLERPSAQEGLSSTVFHISKNLAVFSGIETWTTETARRRQWNQKRIVEYVNPCTPFPLWRWYVQIILVELILKVIRLSMEFQSWKVNLKIEVCTRTADPQITMHWINEFELPKSIDELFTSRSILVQRNFADFEMLDAMIAYALKMLLNTQMHFRKSKCRRAACSESPTDSHEEDNLRTWSTSISAQPEPLKQNKDSQTCAQIFLQNEDVQDFRRKKGSSSVISETMPFQLQIVLALYDQETARNNGQPNYQQLKTAVKLHTDQMMRTRNFRVRSDFVEQRSVTKSQK